MNVSRARGGVFATALAALIVASSSVAAQAPNFDGRPTGFVTDKTGGMPADAWNGTALGTAKRLVSALQPVSQLE